jgi:hypothetical protein
MAKTIKTVETFAKVKIPKDEVEAERKGRLGARALTSEITEDVTNWILTSTWAVSEEPK